MIESVRTPEPRVQGQGICLLRQDQQPRKICDFGMTPVTSSSLVATCNVNQQRVSHSFRRAPRSFQIRYSRSRSTEGQATTVLSEHHNKEQRKRTQRRSATMLAVLLLCPARLFVLDTFDGLCAHMDDHRACRVTSVHTLSTTTKKD